MVNWTCSTCGCHFQDADYWDHTESHIREAVEKAVDNAWERLTWAK